jgi:hypothetical protein
MDFFHAGWGALMVRFEVRCRDLGMGVCMEGSCDGCMSARDLCEVWNGGKK